MAGVSSGTIAPVKQFRETDAAVTLVVAATIDPDAQFVLSTGVGLNDQRIALLEVASYFAGVGLRQFSGKLATDFNELPTTTSNLVDDWIIRRPVGGVDSKISRANFFAGTANLTTLADANTVTVQSDTGTDALLPTADGVTAGVVSAADYNTFVTGSVTNLTTAVTANDVTIESDSGTDAVIPAADGVTAGVLSAVDYNTFATASGATNLASVPTAGNVTITSDTGTDAIIQDADGVIAGVLTAADWNRFDAAATANWTVTPTATQITIFNPVGNDAILVGATGSLAGLLVAADKTKLDTVATGATPVTLHTGVIISDGAGNTVMNTNAVATFNVQDNAITLAKIQDVPAHTVLLNDVTGTVDVQAATVSDLAEGTPAVGAKMLGWDTAGEIKRFDASGFSGAASTVASVAFLRSRVGDPVGTRVELLAHTTAGDQGGGIFEKVVVDGTVAAINRPQVYDDANGHDDNGYHIINGMGGVWARVLMPGDPITYRKFGITPFATDDLAVAGANQNTGTNYGRLQLPLDLWADPANRIPGWQYRPVQPHPALDFLAATGYYRTHTTLDVIYPFTNIENTPQVGRMMFYAWCWVPAPDNGTPSDFEIPAFRLVAKYVSHGWPECTLTCRKEYLSNVVWHASQNWAKIARNWRGESLALTPPDDQSVWRPWSGVTRFEHLETIWHTVGSGETILYKVTAGPTDATTGLPTRSGITSSTAPTHTTGTVANGTLSLQALGVASNTENESVQRKLRKSRDWGVHVQDCSEHKNLNFNVDGFTVGVMCLPNGTDADRVGWNRARCTISGCLFAIHLGYYAVEEVVDSVAQRNTITGLSEFQAGYRAAVHNATPANSDVYEWDGTAWTGPTGWFPRSGEGNWVNDNHFYCNRTTYTQSNSYPDEQSQYGFTLDAWNTWVMNDDAKAPNDNHCEGIAVEHNAVDTTVAEAVHFLIMRGVENSCTKVRVDAPAANFGMLCYEHWDSGQAPNQNYFNCQRSGFFDGSRASQRHLNNGMYNRVEELPYDERASDELSVPSLVQAGVFSGRTKFYPRGWGSFYYNDTTPTLPVNLGTTGQADPVEYHPDDDSFTLTFNDEPFSVEIELPDNDTGLAVIEVSPHEAQPTVSHVATSDARARWIMAQMIDIGNDLGIPLLGANPYPTSPIPSLSGMGDGFDPNIVGTRMQVGTRPAQAKTFYLIPKPFCRRLRLLTSGFRVRGYTVRIRGGSTYNSIRPQQRATNCQTEWFVDEIPEMGKYMTPFTVRLADGSKASINAADGLEYWAVTDLQSNITTTSNDPFFMAVQTVVNQHTRTNTISRWNGTTWDVITTTARFVTPADWIRDYSEVLAMGELSGSAPSSAIVLDGTEQEIDSNLFDLTDSANGMTVNASTGVITVNRDGVYDVTYTYPAVSSISDGQALLILRLTGSAAGDVITPFTFGASAGATLIMTATRRFDLESGDTLQTVLDRTGSNHNVTIQRSGSFRVQQVR